VGHISTIIWKFWTVAASEILSYMYLYKQFIIFINNLINDELFYSFTFSSNTNTSHWDVRQHSSRHPARSCCSTESMNFAPSFFESSVRIILSSCTSNLFTHPNGSTVAAIPAHTAAQMNRKPTGVILSRINKLGVRRTVYYCTI
jgi:hypothetical protein